MTRPPTLPSTGPVTMRTRQGHLTISAAPGRFTVTVRHPTGETSVFDLGPVQVLTLVRMGVRAVGMRRREPKPETADHDDLTGAG